MANCPVCEKNLLDPLPPFCEQCGWDLENDLTLVPSLTEIPESVQEKYIQRINIAKQVWNNLIACVRRRVQEVGFKDNFAGGIDTYWRYWTLAPTPANAAISPVFDADAEDGYMLQLKFSAEGASASSVKGPNLESIEHTHFGSYTARMKTPVVLAGESLVTGFFTYFNDVWISPDNPTDENNNGIADNSEIGIELLAAEPHAIYLSIWTDASYCGSYFRKVTRWIDLHTGRICQTPEEGRHAYDLAELGYVFSPTIPDFDHTAGYYEYGFCWSPNSVRFWIVINGNEVELWNYTNPEHIPTHEAKLMINLWHNHVHWSGACAASPPSQDAFLNVDWAQFQASPNKYVRRISIAKQVWK